LEKSIEDLKKIDNEFLRNALLSIKLREGIEGTLERIGF
jgi:hypothetical protein